MNETLNHSLSDIVLRPLFTHSSLGACGSLVAKRLMLKSLLPAHGWNDFWCVLYYCAVTVCPRLWHGKQWSEQLSVWAWLCRASSHRCWMHVLSCAVLIEHFPSPGRWVWASIVCLKGPTGTIMCLPLLMDSVHARMWQEQLLVTRHTVHILSNKAPGYAKALCWLLRTAALRSLGCLAPEMRSDIAALELTAVSFWYTIPYMSFSHAGWYSAAVIKRPRRRRHSVTAVIWPQTLMDHRRTIMSLSRSAITCSESHKEEEAECDRSPSLSLWHALSDGHTQ